MRKLLLEGRDLVKAFPAGRTKKVHAVNHVSIRIYEGESLALVGESGCGKSTLGRLLLRLIPPDSGEVYLKGKNVTGLPERSFRPYRRQLQLIFQDPYASLNPRMNVEQLIAEPLKECRGTILKEEIPKRVRELMAAVGLPEEYANRYPHQFSGGQRQRIGIARAIAMDPDLIVCDEPVSALDVSVQNQILNLLRDLQKEREMAYLFISHDLSVVRHVSDRVCVMFLGKIVETGPTQEVFAAPLHPYTQLLLAAVPVPDPRRQLDSLPLLTGEAPSPVDLPSGCCFRTRCPYATERCAEEEPVLRGEGGRQAACHML